MKTKSLVYCSVFTALIAVGAFIKIPIPPVPFSLQTMFVILAGLTLGAKRSALCAAVYLLIGLAGIPVFTAGGGLGYLLYPSAGFLIAFIPGAFTVGLVNKKTNSPVYAVIAGNIVIYAIALSYAYIVANFVTGQGLAAKTLLVSYCAIFIPSDIVKSAVAVYINKKLKKSLVL